jgi:hypothetical protein
LPNKISAVISRNKPFFWFVFQVPLVIEGVDVLKFARKEQVAEFPFWGERKDQVHVFVTKILHLLVAVIVKVIVVLDPL